MTPMEVEISGIRYDMQERAASPANAAPTGGDRVGDDVETASGDVQFGECIRNSSLGGCSMASLVDPAGRQHDGVSAEEVGKRQQRMATAVLKELFACKFYTGAVQRFFYNAATNRAECKAVTSMKDLVASHYGSAKASYDEYFKMMDKGLHGDLCYLVLHTVSSRVNTVVFDDDMKMIQAIVRCRRAATPPRRPI